MKAWFFVAVLVTLGWLCAFELGLWVGVRVPRAAAPCETIEPVIDEPGRPPASWRAL